MMTLEEYASDVEKTVEEIMALCDKLGIEYQDENTLLDDTSIVLLDNNMNEEIEEEEQDVEDEEIEDEEELDEKAEELALSTKYDIDDTSENFTKVKKVQKQNTNTNNKDFLKERKKMYKNREKLQSNEHEEDKNVVLYKEGMSVTDLANALEVTPVEIVKKLMGLGIMANVNQAVDFDSAEIIVLEYEKVLKKEETADISNFENYEIEDKAED